MKTIRTKTVKANDAVVVDSAASTLLFEAEDVAELLAEVTESPVEVSIEDENVVIFNVDGDEFTVEAEGDEEIVESATCAKEPQKQWAKRGTLRENDITASRRSRVVTSSKKPAGKVIRKVPTRR